MITTAKFRGSGLNVYIIKQNHVINVTILAIMNLFIYNLPLQ